MFFLFYWEGMHILLAQNTFIPVTCLSLLVIYITAKTAAVRLQKYYQILKSILIYWLYWTQILAYLPLQHVYVNHDLSFHDFWLTITIV